MPTLKRMGRPPAGPSGENVTAYPRITLRLHPTVKAALIEADSEDGQPAWRIVQAALCHRLGIDDPEEAPPAWPMTSASRPKQKPSHTTAPPLFALDEV